MDTSEQNRRWYDHTSDIAQLKAVQLQHSKELNALSVSLSTLSEQFKQVKWTVFGAAAFYVLQTIGLVDVIRGWL